MIIIFGIVEKKTNIVLLKELLLGWGQIHARQLRHVGDVDLLGPAHG